MFFNYLKTGLRNILKYKVFSFINVAGLAAAMSVCMLIILMLADQKSHDQWNVKKDRIYRILCDGPDFRHPYATSPFPLAPVLKTNYPGIETATGLMMGVGGDARYNGKSFELRGYFADAAFFDVFSYDLERGDKRTALAAPNALVITHTMARQLFGDKDPIGRTVEWVDRGLNAFGGTYAAASTPWGSFTITGVIADKGYKSHLVFDMLMSAASMPTLTLQGKLTDHMGDWNDYYNCYTYVLLKSGASLQDLDAALHQLATRKYAGVKDFKGFTMMGQPLARISPGRLLGNESTIILPVVAYYFLSALALVIMLMACLNYINLSVARALQRAREIGVRKVTGALRNDLILQFLSESVLTALCAMVMAVVLLFGLKSAAMGLWVNQYLHFELRENMGLYVIFTGLALVIGLIAGLYPALYLSRLQPILALKSTDGGRAGRLGMRKVLSVTQFVVSLVFIITTLLIYNQFRYFMHFHYEFNSTNIVNIALQGNDYRLVTQEFGRAPGVAGVSASEYMPATTRSEGMQLRRADAPKQEYAEVMSLPVDDHWIDNMGLRLVAGRNLPPRFAVALREGGQADTSAGSAGSRYIASRYIVMNEEAVRLFGYPSPAAAIGQAFRTSWSDSLLIVCGVVQNFHMRMILGNDKMEAVVLQNSPRSFEYANVKIASNDIRGTIARLEDRWKRIDPLHPMKYEFYSDALAAGAQGVFDVVSILGFVALLAVLIACLGMLGMAMYTTERRRKEVGIRKVLGAANVSNVLLLSREFVGVLLVAVGIAAPLSYFLNTMWLRNFPNRVEFGWGTVLTGVAIVMGLGLVTIGSQTIRASRRNPVEGLRAD
jgi:putative ABC transport system permease protein